MQRCYRELGRLEERVEPVGTATVVTVRGAAPGEVGAKMLEQRGAARV